MVAEGLRYRSGSASASAYSASSSASSAAVAAHVPSKYLSSSHSRYQSTSNSSVGKYAAGPTNDSYLNNKFSSSSFSAAAPVFGRIRITQSVEREGMGRYADAAANRFANAPVALPSYGRRYSLATERILQKNKSLASDYDDSDDNYDASPYTQTRHHVSQLYGRVGGEGGGAGEGGGGRANVYSNYGNSPAFGSSSAHHRLSAIDVGGSYSSFSPTAAYRSGTSMRRSARASSVSGYESHNSYYGTGGRSSNYYSAYDEQPSSSYGKGGLRASSVSRYENQIYYGQGGRASSVSRYENHNSRGRSMQSRDRSASRYGSYNDINNGEYSQSRASSVSRADYTFTMPASDDEAGEDHDDSAYELRRQLRALKNQQIRAGSTTQNDVRAGGIRAGSVSSTDVTVRASSVRAGSVIRAGSVPRTDVRAGSVRAGSVPRTVDVRARSVRATSVSRAEKQDQHQRPRSYSINTHRDIQRKIYKVARVVPTPGCTSIITGPADYALGVSSVTGTNPEPTLYSARVLQSTSTEGAENRDSALHLRPASGFIDNRDDITSFVLQPGESFLPTDISVSVLPSGKKAVTYTRFSQKGSGDQRDANAEIDRIVRKTRNMQDSMYTLENFVKRNRSLFPEDIIIYQKIIFYLLSEAELIKMGERPDAEIYGIKIREKLVAPIGTDVSGILRRYYSKHKNVDVEYEKPEVIRRKLNAVSEADDNNRKRNHPPSANGPRPEEFDFDHWFPTRRSHSSDNKHPLYIDEDELMLRDRRGRPTAGAAAAKPQRPSMPEFTHKLRPLKAAKGQTVRFSCSVAGFPEPVVTWYRGKQEVTDNGRFSTRNNFGLCTLSILDLTLNDAALYTAKATNDDGEASSNAVLEVYDWAAETTPSSAKQSQRRSAEASAAGTGRRPFFLLEARNLWSELGERAVFEVQAAGKPIPSFTWFKDDVEVPSNGDRIQMVADGFGNCKLVIKEVEPSDIGTYCCRAKNEDGTTECLASLHNVGNENVRPGQAMINELRASSGQIPPRGKKPRFIQLPPSNLEVMEGQPLTLKCTVEGDPKPVVIWYKGVRELTYTGRHRVLEEMNNRYVMQIKSMLTTDSGEYIVTAHNACGLIEYSVFVNVTTSTPMDEFDPTWKRPDLTSLDYELVSKTRQGKLPPIFVKKLPREKEMKVGSSLKLDCQIEEVKTREYLVDVDIVRKDKTKEEDVNAEHKKNRPTTEKESLLNSQIRKENFVSSINAVGPTERSVDEEETAFSFDPESISDKLMTRKPREEESSVNRGGKLDVMAANLAEEISKEAVLESVNGNIVEGMTEAETKEPPTSSVESKEKVSTQELISVANVITRESERVSEATDSRATKTKEPENEEVEEDLSSENSKLSSIESDNES